MPPNPSGIIDFFLHPTFNFITSSTTSPSAISNPLTGHNVLSASVGIASSYGIVWAISFAPPFAGHTVSTFVRYEDPVLRLWVTHTLASGLVVITQQFESADQNGILFWDHLLPSSVVIDVFPNYQLTVEWMVGI